jgi:hypothetical protein
MVAATEKEDTVYGAVAQHVGDMAYNNSNKYLVYTYGCVSTSFTLDTSSHTHSTHTLFFL